MLDQPQVSSKQLDQGVFVVFVNPKRTSKNKARKQMLREFEALWPGRESRDVATRQRERQAAVEASRETVDGVMNHLPRKHRRAMARKLAKEVRRRAKVG